VSGAGQKPVKREQKICRSVEQKRSGERAKLTAHIPLQCNSSQIT